MAAEKNIQNKIIDYIKDLQKHGVKISYDRRQAGGFSYKKGIADLSVFYYNFKGAFEMDVEIKTHNTNMSSSQETRKRYCDKLGKIYICVHSLEEFKSYMEGLINNEKQI